MASLHTVMQDMRLLVVSITLAAAVSTAAPVRAEEAPDALVNRLSTETVATIKSDPLIQAGDQARIREVMEAKLVPHFDFTRMTALAMGRNWRAATPEQQKRLADEFRTLLVRTYAGALNKYRNETIETKPLRAGAGETEVTVKSVVNRPAGQPVQIDYSMEKTPDGWKAYDVIVGGVSLVTNYRDEFSEQIKNGGIDGLLKTLAEKNSKSGADTKGGGAK